MRKPKRTLRSAVRTTRALPRLRPRLRLTREKGRTSAYRRSRASRWGTHERINIQETTKHGRTVAAGQTVTRLGTGGRTRSTNHTRTVISNEGIIRPTTEKGGKSRRHEHCCLPVKDTVTTAPPCTSVRHVFSSLFSRRQRIIYCFSLYYCYSRVVLSEIPVPAVPERP